MNEPACWSWEIPPARDLDEEFARYMRLQDTLCVRAAEAGLRVERWTPGALSMVYRSSSRLRWYEFHTGERLSPGHDPHPRCAICGRPVQQPVDDHDHWTGIVRGWLCRSCNIREGIGSFDEAPAFEKYRERPPSVILDIRTYYSGRGWPHGWWDDEALGRALTGNPDWTRVGETELEGRRP
jgi:hypothetical protein